MFRKYLYYILRHKWYVFKECSKRGLIWKGIVHDISKFLPSEWIPYMHFFFDNKEKYKKEFRQAFLKHQNRNPHHWQYWVDRQGCAYDMPEKYLVEMICDWIGAGKAQGKCYSHEVREWYEKNKFDMILHENTRKKVEEYLRKL